MRIATGSDGKKYETNEPVIITDNTQVIYALETKVAELESKLAIAIEALEHYSNMKHLDCPVQQKAREALAKIKGE